MHSLSVDLTWRHLSFTCMLSAQTFSSLWVSLVSIFRVSDRMPAANGAACIACGGDANLVQCLQCKDRLKDKGVISAICQVCFDDDTLLETVGIRAASGSASPAGFHCRPCALFVKRLQDEQLINTVGGMEPREILKTVAHTAPWFLTLRRAEPDKLLSALNKLKRRTDFNATSTELANGLAARDALPALLLHSFSSGSSDPLCQRALETYVTSKCPSIKFKTLLLAEYGGSMDKARRHFTDQSVNPDPLVAALAMERLFLCNWVEKQCTPVPKRGAKYALGVPDAPYEAAEWLRCIFRSLSLRIKSAAARDTAANILVKTWYMDHLAIAHNMMSARVVQSAAAALHAPLHLGPVGSGDQPVAKRAKTDKPPAKGKGLGKVGKPSPASFEWNVPQGNMDHKKLPAALKAYLKPNLSVAQANAALKEAGVQHKIELYHVFKPFCRNCWAGGRGWVPHSLASCRQSGTACSLDCPKCGPGNYHWAESCPKK